MRLAKGHLRDLGKERFGWLLKQRGIPFVDEASLGERLVPRGTQPDSLIVPAEPLRILVEVEGFRDPGPLRKARARVYATGPEVALRRLRTAVQHAVNQLKPYRDEKIAMMVVLDDAYRTGVPLGVWELISLFGVPEIRRLLDVNTGDWAGPPHVEGSEESFHVLMPDKNAHVSAVAVNLPKDGYQHADPPGDERPTRLRILHNPYASVPMPPWVFFDPADEQIGLRGGWWVESGTGHRLLRGKHIAQ